MAKPQHEPIEPERPQDVKPEPSRDAAEGDREIIEDDLRRKEGGEPKRR
ncbi:MAG: hypothetical protein IT168_28475 [Bryobacterales bacterium]|nr:hypothetical protein [Bryobacterales bacterium]